MKASVIVELDLKAGCSVFRSPSGRELWRTPLPESLMEAWRELKRVQLKASMFQRCRKIEARQQRRAK